MPEYVTGADIATPPDVIAAGVPHVVRSSVRPKVVRVVGPIGWLMPSLVTMSAPFLYT